MNNGHDGHDEMIRDILGWPIPADRKLEHIAHVLEEAPVAVAEEERPAPRRRTAAPRPSRRPAEEAAARPSRRRTPEEATRTALWRQLKRVAPERADELGYQHATKERLQEVLEEIKK